MEFYCTAVTDALDLVKDLFGSSFLSLLKIDFCERITEEVGDDDEVLRYARDLLFAIAKRKKMLNSSYTLVERKAGEGLIDKLVKDIYKIFSYCEGGSESLPKSLAKDNGQSVVDVEGLALSVQETIKFTVDESVLLIKETAAEIQKRALDASLMDLKSFLTVEINRHEEHLKVTHSDLDSVLNKPVEALDVSKNKSPQIHVSVATKPFERTCGGLRRRKMKELVREAKSSKANHNGGRRNNLFL